MYYGKLYQKELVLVMKKSVFDSSLSVASVHRSFSSLDTTALIGWHKLKIQI
jgi:hypothetical protein